MRKNRLFTIIFFSILGIVLLVFFYLNTDKHKYNWNESYDPQSSQPYGTQFIRDLLKSYATGGFTYNTEKSIQELLDSANIKGKSSYVFLGESMHLDSSDVASMQQYVTNGNEVFLFTNYLPYNLRTAFYETECSSEFSTHTVDTITIRANFYHPSFATKVPYTFSFRVGDKDTKYYWHYLSAQALCDSVRSVVPLGYFSPDYVNFYKIPYGKGNLYVHANPIVFTNYFMVVERNTEYASSVFSYSASKNFIWDESSKTPYNFKNRNPYYNPLYFIMQQPSLQYAWWVMLALTLLYVFFTAKRRQRFIPVLEPKTNTSMAFLQMVSTLHFRNNNHGDMARKKMRYFLHFVRMRYGLSTHKTDEEFMKKLAQKSQVSIDEIETIFNQYHVIEKFHSIDSTRLAHVYNAIQNFYNKAK